jgi:hypothetical protein
MSKGRAKKKKKKIKKKTKIEINVNCLVDLSKITFYCVKVELLLFSMISFVRWICFSLLFAWFIFILLLYSFLTLNLSFIKLSVLIRFFSN